MSKIKQEIKQQPSLDTRPYHHGQNVPVNEIYTVTQQIQAIDDLLKILKSEHEESNRDTRAALLQQKK